ncbi:RES family NAD+ phosphorylase [Proteus mirabilis]|uniref:RES family NAD+ phosphorylase n=1 Tax=Proteus mirabilis TaxID=584 RepID=UPI001ADB6826|nr:RES family NAD+ phosphorylase [Proteus mirabilis]MBO8260481.1 RES family NAD+ phosphorylase [Proteus mirabilis]MBO8267337.1 RES family NAD+ phosphorylase [Proteus mirabilis]MBO8269362.1 RES family NAD+ phosphorylase [Proteus mirabilis]MBO8271873.1 RES family NAD+ phosphorylase [Proteus mirabilis]MBO8275514.1 RES family NAD+ phosphorylase [Proteus mirabilis]
MKICIKHIKEENVLKLAISKNEIAKCCVCNTTNICIDSECSDFHDMLRAIIRYFYDEHKYNGHLGGDETPSSIIQSSDFIFKDEVFSDKERVYDLDSEFYDIGSYFDDDKGVSLYAGYFNGMQNMPLESISNDEDIRITSLQKKLEVSNYYEHEDFIKDSISQYVGRFDYILKEEDELYRARVGYMDSKVAYKDGFSRAGVKFYSPFCGDKISAVPPLNANEGRANRAGVSFLYCATNEYTTIAEVRPHPSDIVSIAKFKVNSDLKLFDLSYPHLIHYYHCETSMKELRTYATIAKIFNIATPPSLKGRYLVTQLIANAIRQLGYDGIIFSSTVGDGKNIVIFTPENASIVENSEYVVNINSVIYTFVKSGVIGRDDENVTYKDDIRTGIL